MRFILGREHGDPTWRVLFGPDKSRAAHKKFWNSKKFRNHLDPVFAEIYKTNAGAHKLFTNPGPNQGPFSSSSASSASSNSSSSSVNSSSSSSSSST